MMLQYVLYLPPTELISKTPNLEKIPFVWNIMRSEEYMNQIKAAGDGKKFDFIHMIHVLTYHFDLMFCCMILLHHICCDIFPS